MGTLDLRPVFPALIVAVTGLIVLLLRAFTPAGRRAPAAELSLVGLGGGLLAVFLVAQSGGPVAVTGGSVTADDFALFTQGLILGIGVLTVLFSPSYLRATGMDRVEYYALVLFAIVGMLGLVSCLELVSLFVALEIMSIALYGLAGFHRQRPESQEAALKYFLPGAFSSAFFLYGVALLYGVSGSTTLEPIASAMNRLPAGGAPLAVLGVGFLLVGFGFKVASVPFHMWVPDVYEGAPTTVTAFMSAGVKAAAFGALLRVFTSGLAALAGGWKPAVAVLAIVTMVFGNLGALAQSNLKRMGREPLSLSDVAGLATRRPALAAALTVFLVSLAGVPVSAGFVGKFYLFGAAVSAGRTVLAVVGVLMSVVSAYYYLRVVVAMYMREPLGEDAWGPVSAGSALALAVSVAVVLGLGVYPGPVLALARQAARSLQ